MGVTVRNAVVQNEGRTLASAHFVAAQGLSRTDKIAALSVLVDNAAASLGLPARGPEAAEILYQIADDRAGAATVAFDPTPDVSAPPAPPTAKERMRALASRILPLAIAGLAAGLAIGAILRGA